jgi:hypothetical protein
MYLLSINTVQAQHLLRLHHFYYNASKQLFVHQLPASVQFLSGISSCRLTLNIVVINSFLSVVNI